MIRIGLTVVGLGVAAAHVIWPDLKIDLITFGCIVLAALPWLAPVIKSIELPGLGKVELNDVSRAAESAVKAGLAEPEVLSPGSPVAGRQEHQLSDQEPAGQEPARQEPAGQEPAGREPAGQKPEGLPETEDGNLPDPLVVEVTRPEAQSLPSGASDRNLGEISEFIDEAGTKWVRVETTKGAKKGHGETARIRLVLEKSKSAGGHKPESGGYNSGFEFGSDLPPHSADRYKQSVSRNSYNSVPEGMLLLQRREIEKSLRELASLAGMGGDKLTSGRLLSLLVQAEVLTKDQENALRQLLNILNAVAHGADIDEMALMNATQLSFYVLSNLKLMINEWQSYANLRESGLATSSDRPRPLPSHQFNFDRPML